MPGHAHCRAIRGAPVVGCITLFLRKGLASNPLFVDQTGCAEGRSPFAGGTGVPPVVGFITPFLERKGDGGMVERAVGTGATAEPDTLGLLRRNP